MVACFVKYQVVLDKVHITVLDQSCSTSAGVMEDKIFVSLVQYLIVLEPLSEIRITSEGKSTSVKYYIYASY